MTLHFHSYLVDIVFLLKSFWLGWFSRTRKLRWNVNFRNL